MAGRRYCSLMKTIHHFCPCTCICLKSCVDEINLDLKRDALHFLRTHYFFRFVLAHAMPFGIFFAKLLFYKASVVVFMTHWVCHIPFTHFWMVHTTKIFQKGDFFCLQKVFFLTILRILSCTCKLVAVAICNITFFCIKKEHKILKCMQMLFPWWDSRGGALRVCDAHTLKRSEKPLSLCHTTKSISHLRSFFGLMLFKD